MFRGARYWHERHNVITARVRRDSKVEPLTPARSYYAASDRETHATQVLDAEARIVPRSCARLRESGLLREIDTFGTAETDC
jgi:hypothetical protein